MVQFEDLMEVEPTGIRWTFSDTTGCGIRAFRRPCQLRPGVGLVESNFPADPLCASLRESVFIVEDDEDLRADLVEMIGDMGYNAIGCASPGEFEKSLTRADTGCLILDIRLQGGDGISILERLKGSGSSLPAIMLTGLKDPAVAADCIKIGAVEYIVKPANEMALRRSIDRAIAQSRSNFCRSQSKALIAGMLSRLTQAEEKIAEMLAQGYSTKLIAGELGRSENTVKIHRHRIMAKLKINSVASLANIYNHIRDA